jgi:hypothetical protein
MVTTGLSPERQHERFEELAAIAAMGELQAPEFEELREHLASCDGCRDVYADFCHIASSDLGLLAVKSGRPASAHAPGQVDAATVLANIKAKALQAMPVRNEFSKIPHRPGKSISAYWSDFKCFVPKVSYAVGAMAVMAALVAVGYLVRERQFRPVISKYETQLALLHENSQQTSASRHSLEDALAQSQVELQETSAELHEAEVERSRLRQQRDQIQQKFESAEALALQTQSDLKVSESRREQEARVRNQLQQELLEAKDRLDAQDQTVADLRAKLEKKESAAVPEVASANDKNDARQLFGARDLHIVDVYDVDTNGKTKRTYGRVYYVEKKLLVFYAFDLQYKRNNREAAAFQAWGYREAGERKPENLGLFRLDDAAANRWVLQVNNPHVLERVEAVYVTLEPSAGSQSPRGRRLLYANLLAPPNHP